MTGRQPWRSRQSLRRPPLRHAIVNRRRWYRIAAAVTAVVGAAALALGASGQLFAPALAPSTTKAVLSQAASTQAVARAPPTTCPAGAPEEGEPAGAGHAVMRRRSTPT